MKPTKTNLKRILTRGKFQAYLDGRDGYLIAGKCQCPKTCAIADYISESLDIPDKHLVSVGVGAKIVRMAQGDEPRIVVVIVDLPDWADNFINKFDILYQNTDGSYRKTKTFKEAADILRNV